MTELFLKIEEAESLHDEATELNEAIRDLARHYHPTAALLIAYTDAILAGENLWREIESRVDYQAKYTSREQARADFLKEYFQRR